MNKLKSFLSVCMIASAALVFLAVPSKADFFLARPFISRGFYYQPPNLMPGWGYWNPNPYPPYNYGLNSYNQGWYPSGNPYYAAFSPGFYGPAPSAGAPSTEWVY